MPGEDLPHVSHYYREPHPHYRQRVVIVGGKNSAAEAALELYRAGAQVLLVHRGEALGESIKYWVKPDIENRIKEGSIEARFSTRVVEITHDRMSCSRARTAERCEPADAVLLLTGYRSDTTLLRMAGAAIDETDEAPVHDPDTFESTVPESVSWSAPSSPGSQSGTHLHRERPLPRRSRRRRDRATTARIGRSEHHISRSVIG